MKNGDFKTEFDSVPREQREMTDPDWYERRDSLRSGMIFDSHYGIVKLDRQVPGDGTDWYVADWIAGRPGVPGYERGHFSYEDSRIHPSDLIERLPYDFAGWVSE